MNHQRNRPQLTTDQLERKLNNVISWIPMFWQRITEEGKTISIQGYPSPLEIVGLSYEGSYQYAAKIAYPADKVAEIIIGAGFRVHHTQMFVDAGIVKTWVFFLDGADGDKVPKRVLLW